MKCEIYDDERYPTIFLYEHKALTSLNTYEVPDELYERYNKVHEELNNVEQDLLELKFKN